VLGREPFRDDVLASARLDDRRSSNGYLSRAEELMAEAVHAEHAFFSTCGSSLSVEAVMLAVAGGDGELWVSRHAHKSMVAGLIFAGVQAPVDPAALRPRAAPRAPAGTRGRRRRVGSTPGRDGRAHCQPHPVRHVR
jgi:arginine/lysine/ornithine decarboxylase